MERTPRVSIIMPLYNCAKYLEATLKTVLEQSFKEWEIVAQDGGSTDGTVEILKKYAAADPRITYVSEKDDGVYDAIHRGAQRARTEYLMVLCASDGYVNRDWIKKAVAALDKDNELALVWGIPFDMSEDGKLIGPNYIYAHFLENNTLKQRTTILRNIIARINLRHPIKSISELAKKATKTNLTAAAHILKKEAPAQKQEWFTYWLKTGIIFPDGNMCLSTKVFKECLPPHKQGSREPGDWMGFFFNINAKGYLTQCIPVPANFGRFHGGQISETMAAYNTQNRKEYHDNVLRLREAGGTVQFKNRNGEPIGDTKTASHPKLHLGCGETYLPGYINVDYPPSEHSVMSVKADQYGDIRTLTYPENSVAEIRTHHMFEHFTRAEALKLLATWHGWLIPGGRIVIETPDFKRCARAYTFAWSQKRRMELGRHMFGSQEAKWAIHYDFWDAPKFKYILSRFGFENIKCTSIANSFKKHYGHIPFANFIGNLIPDSVYQKRGGHKLPNILVAAEKVKTKPDFKEAAKEILATYLVGKEKTDLLDVWMKEFES